MTTGSLPPFNLRLHSRKMIVVTFAVPQESRAFRGVMRHAGRGGVPPVEYLLGNVGGEEVILLHTGVGREAASARIEALLAQVRPVAVLAAGFAGGLDPRVRSGDLVVATNVTEPGLGARARALFGDDPRVFFGPILGAPIPVETAEDKAELGRHYGGLAVDMETAVLAGAATRAGVPFLAVRAISDAVEEPLPVPFAEWFDLRSQRPRSVALVRYLRRHPRQVIPFMRFVHGLGPASAALAEFLQRFIESASEPATRR